MKLTLPELSLVVLIGPSGSGKSTFAKKHFLASEVLSSDFCRFLVSDDENSQAATSDAFDVLHYIAAKRLAAAKLTVVDATNVQKEARKPLVDLARQYHVLPVAIVLNLPERVCADQNRNRPDRNFGPHVVRNQSQELRRSLKGLDHEGFRHVHVLSSLDEIEAAVIERQPLWNNRRFDHGPFDIIGDVHGCFDELIELLQRLGYAITREADQYKVLPPSGRKALFVGDLVDRGPKVAKVLQLVMAMADSGVALCVPGNHDMKLVKKLRGSDVQMTHGLAETWAELERESPEFRKRTLAFLDGLVSHYVLDGGGLVVAHAGMKEEMQGRGSGKVREFALYGETTGETDEFGLPIRVNWAAEYRGRAMVVYGHTPVPEPEWLNRTVNIDTGCAFGGALTALRYPEKEFVSVPAKHTYYAPARPFIPEGTAPEPKLTAQQRQDELLDIDDVVGKRIIATRLHRTVTIREENATAALEVMSRFAANPKWLIYLPPTMSPSETSRRAGYLEYPEEAFAYFRHEGVATVVCEQKHMGSRAVIIVCRDEESARENFGVIGEGIGICYTRTGRRFFSDASLEQALLEKVQAAVTSSGLWEDLKTDWLCLDCELMPWSAKAQELLREQYAPTGAAARASFPYVVAALESAAHCVPEISGIAKHYRERQRLADRYVASYRRYCWPVNSIADLRLAPFHLLASAGRVYTDADHIWHMETLSKLVAADPGLLIATAFRRVDLADGASVADATNWWEELTGSGSEGMVVKPLHFVQPGRRDLVQPAVKCRGREYLRIIYGPEYTQEENLMRLRERGLGTKRSLAIREFALGIEALERFVRAEPLRRVHECVFGVLALESEAVDPRL
ncbi:MAG: polynucleotide kinase-phosphatase [Acidobacteriaceae bacterium]|nr:polynucleotide kinase-phosphatase [Acidobacteriaceae bacterium]